MRLLHVGSGFRPLRRGGLVAYIEDLMDEQVRRGDDVAYFFSGRQYPLARGPRMRRWERGGVSMFEVVNSPLYDHGRQPDLEMGEPRIEELFRTSLRDFRPDAVHFQELAGLPFSLLDVVGEAGTPAIVTLQDYFFLCSTFKLIDAGGQVCLRRQIGADCMATTNADQSEPGLMVHSTVVHELRGIRVVRRANRSLDPIYWQIADTLSRWEATRRGRRRRAATPETFQRRRDTNIERLSRADCVIAMSRRVAEIHTQLGVDPGRMRTLQLTLRHIERLRPRRASGQAPVTFATLAGFESVPKGGHLLLEAMRRLAEPAAVGRLRLVVHGRVRPEFAAAAEAIPGLEVRGGYLPEHLDALLDEVDVGLVPSVWEEAYGYAGMEFLAKGIPVIANAIGGMTDYVREGETGWLNRSLTSEELARIMGEVAADPGRVADMNTRLIETRGSIVKPMADHAEEMDAVYREAIRGRPAGRAA